MIQLLVYIQMKEGEMIKVREGKIWVETESDLKQALNKFSVEDMVKIRMDWILKKGTEHEPRN